MSDDPVDLWHKTVERVCGLVLDLSADDVQRHVPACPDWTVRDLLAHMVGLGVSTLAGEEPDDHNEAWTQGHVDARAGRSVDDLVDEWRGVTTGLMAWMRENGSRPLNDAVIHEQDLRGAVDRPGARGTAELAVVRDRLLERFVGRLGDLPPLALCGSQWTWASDGTPDDAETILEASDFDLTRAVMSRRAAAELRGWVVRGDVAPYLDAFAHLGPLPEARLPER